MHFSSLCYFFCVFLVEERWAFGFKISDWLNYKKLSPAKVIQNKNWEGL